MATGFTINGTEVSTAVQFVPLNYILDHYTDFGPNFFKSNTLWVSGYNVSGQLGDLTAVSKSSHVLLYGNYNTYGPGTNWGPFNQGGRLVTASIKDGYAFSWGIGSNGGLGNSGVASSSFPVVTTGAQQNFKFLASGNYHTLALGHDSKIYAWGYNGYGQLGTGGIVNTSSPIGALSGIAGWKKIAAGSYGSSAAIKETGTLWFWGYNASGQFSCSGGNDRNPRSSPTQISSGGTWQDVTLGQEHMLAIKSDGTLWTSGSNSYGQQGYGDTQSRSSLIQVGSDTTWKKVSAGFHVSFAIKTDGTLWGWGYNLGGQLGDNTRTHRSSPVQTVTGGTNWYTVSAAVSVAALKTDGTFWVWGGNANGSLGLLDLVGRSSPVQIGTDTTWRYCRGGDFTTMGIKDYTPTLGQDGYQIGVV